MNQCAPHRSTLKGEAEEDNEGARRSAGDFSHQILDAEGV